MIISYKFKNIMSKIKILITPNQADEISNKLKKTSASEKGTDFENYIFELFKKTDLFSDLTKKTIDKNKFINIDSKTSYGEERKTIKKLFIQLMGKFKNMKPQTTLKGDYLIQINGEDEVFDAKNYDSIIPIFKFPEIEGLSPKSFMKGSDSNIKYPTFYYLKNHATILYNFLFPSNNTKKNEAKAIIETEFTTKKQITEITKDEFIAIFRMTELGYAWKEFNIIPKRNFIIKSGKKIQYKFASFDEIPNNNVIVDLLTQNGYLYLFFTQNDNILFILSQRVSGQGNCSFINLDYVHLVNEVNANDYELKTLQ
jgi:hypothetical protein